MRIQLRRLDLRITVSSVYPPKNAYARVQTLFHWIRVLPSLLCDFCDSAREQATPAPASGLASATNCSTLPNRPTSHICIACVSLLCPAKLSGSTLWLNKLRTSPDRAERCSVMSVSLTPSCGFSSLQSYEQLIPDIGSTLTLWDRERGHATKHTTGMGSI